MKKLLTTILILATAITTSCDFLDELNEIDDPIEESTEQKADIVSFTFDGIESDAQIDKTALTVTAQAKQATDLTKIAPSFTLSENATAKVGNITQQSGKTVNDFTNSVTYRISSGDGKKENKWTVTITKEAIVPPTQGGDFTKRTFGSAREVLDFFPEGVFFTNVTINYANMVCCKSADGVYTEFGIPQNIFEPGDHDYIDNWHTDLETDYYTYRWRIWKEESYYELTTEMYTDENDKKRTFFTYDQIEYPGKDAIIERDDDGYACGKEYLSFYVNFLFTDFITNINCEKATFEKNEEVAGLMCKKYVYRYEFLSIVTVDEWWVLDNGFCLRHVESNNYENGELKAVKDQKVTYANLNVATYNSLIEAYYVEGGLGFKASQPPYIPLEQMEFGYYCKWADEWQNCGYEPWTKGNIIKMSIWRDFARKGHPIVGGRAFIDLDKTPESNIAEWEERVIKNRDCAVTKNEDYSYGTYRLVTWAADNYKCRETCTHPLGFVQYCEVYTMQFPSSASTLNSIDPDIGGEIMIEVYPLKHVVL